jgi:hypothetical protein
MPNNSEEEQTQRKSKNPTKIDTGETQGSNKVLFLPNGGTCSHSVFDNLFIRTGAGCIRRCANCKRIIVKNCPCTPQTLKTSLPCSIKKRMGRWAINK